MRQCQFMLEDNEKNNIKILILIQTLRFEDMGVQKV
jgi:hypothetical protein